MTGLLPGRLRSRGRGRVRGLLRQLTFLLLYAGSWCALRAQAVVGRAEAVAGKVVDARTGAPLAHALVTLSRVRPARPEGSVYTDSNGQFHFDAVAPGRYRLLGEAANHLPAAYLQHGPLSTAIVTGAGLPVDALVLVLQPAATLTGRIVDEAGDPIASAQVTLYRQGTETGQTAVRPFSL